ncbi:MAG: hypothetical protein LBR80_05090 [Deltaproteobacteria bacterium]|jgi:hypothetical protein|nr:hypothetical protein [Deltaproteobacteria bacterium]
MDSIKQAEDQVFTLIAGAEIAAADADGIRRFRGTAYGGGIIMDHCMWDRVIFDLKTTRAPDKMPVLWTTIRGR